ncbi:hypothetical protein PVAND_013585 [Polypedilum vanderplanki]|uniref:PSI domain-containing protein n=1 Tax=Polypedilum vanderplanki TaxID=319348 RepID=A0A9J6CRU8_POLVA|nr:hypothetical protein PVAND_013585 [Polypedilum vanderplanki]
MTHESFCFKVLIVLCLTLSIFDNVVSTESTLIEQKVPPVNTTNTSNNSVNQPASSNSATFTTTNVPDINSVVPITASQNTLTSSTIAPSLAPEIKISNKTGNFTESEENGPEIDWSDVDITDEERNKTLIDKGLKDIQEDTHEYYNSTIYQNENFTNFHRTSIFADCSNLTVNKLLSKSHRRAMTVKLPFSFQFYGHPINNITIATGGFLYAGDYIHSWLAATQYISPLMANFDPSLSNDSYVKYCEDDKAFHVYWERVLLQNKPEVGPFTFSASLHQDGDIVFAYYYLPIPISEIEDDKHPVKVGVSDAYIVDKTVFQARRKTIFEYHRVNFPGPDIRNFTRIVLKPLPTCHTFTDCQTCLSSDIKFTCYWCPTLNRCSSGVDRKRQEWTSAGCDKSQFANVQLCTKAPDFPATTTPNTNSSKENVTAITTNDNERQASPVTQHAEKSGTGFLTAICSIFAIALLAICWVFYAYTHPHTSSGQFLIQYRPNAWRWRRGEARYTAATIHM